MNRREHAVGKELWTKSQLEIVALRRCKTQIEIALLPCFVCGASMNTHSWIGGYRLCPMSGSADQMLEHRDATDKDDTSL